MGMSLFVPRKKRSSKSNRSSKSKLIRRGRERERERERGRGRGRGRGRRREGDSFFAPEIPLDLVIEIMARLPGKSLMRFKCVSKLWSSLIRSRYFSNLYYTLASPRRPPRLYITVVDQFQRGCCSLMELEVCNNPHKSLLLSLKSSSSNTANKYFYQDLAVPGMGGRNVVILRGLLLYNVCSKACIYYPTTRESLYLPAVKSTIFPQKRIHNRVVYSFGHDPVLDQYKVFCTVVTASKYFKRITSEHWVLVLEAGGGSWKRVQFGLPHYPTGPGLCFDGVIYYLASTGMCREILVSFDVRCEKLNMIQVPHVVSEFGKDAGLIQYGGKPAIFDHTNLGGKGYADLWVLEGAGNWSTKSLVLPPCQIHLLHNNIGFRLQGTTQKGEVILVPCKFSSLSYILFYDLQKNNLKKIEIKGKLERITKPFFCVKLMDKSESIIHLET